MLGFCLRCVRNRLPQIIHLCAARNADSTSSGHYKRAVKPYAASPAGFGSRQFPTSLVVSSSFSLSLEDNGKTFASHVIGLLRVSGFRPFCRLWIPSGRWVATAGLERSATQYPLPISGGRLIVKSLVPLANSICRIPSRAGRASKKKLPCCLVSPIPTDL